MKRSVKNLLTLLSLVIVIATCSFVAACNDPDSPSPEPFVSGFNIESLVDGKLSVSSATTTYDFDTAVVANEGVTFTVSTDQAGLEVLPSGLISLAYGDNYYYITLTNGSASETVKVNIYRKRAYQVTYNLDGGQGAFPSATVDEGDKVTQPTAQPTKVGYEFDGWTYDFNQSVTSAVTVTAKWKAFVSGYALENADLNGKVVVASSLASYNFDAAISVNSGITVEVADEENGDDLANHTVALTPGDNIFYITLSKGVNIETHTVNIYRTKQFTATFDTDGGNGTFDSQTIDENTLVTEPATDPEKPGYSFMGWDYDFTQPLTSDITVTAVWELNTGFAFENAVWGTGAEAKNGKVSVANAVTTFDFDDAITVNSGITVSIATTDGGEDISNHTVDLVAGNNIYYITVSASVTDKENYTVNIYRNKMFAVTFNLDGGTGTFDSYEAEEGTTLTAPTAQPEKIGYSFDGWDYDFSANAKVTAPVEIKALWAAANVNYTVKYYFNDDGVSFNQNLTLKADEVSQALTGSTAEVTAPTVDGYEFDAESSTTNGTVQADGSLVLSLNYYKLVEVNGTVTVPASDSNLVVTVTYGDDSVLETTSALDNKTISVSATLRVNTNTYTVRALGYTETATFTLTGASAGEFTLTPATYEFGAFTKDGLEYGSSTYTESNAPAAGNDSDNLGTWLYGESIYTGNTTLGNLNLGRYLQARGIPRAIYYEGFNEENYAVKADIHTFWNLLVTGTGGSNNSARNGGIAIATPHDQMYITIAESGAIWIAFGNISDDTNMPNADFYFRPANPVFETTNPANGKTNPTLMGGYPMTVIRENNVLSVYVNGIKYLDLDPENGYVGYEHLALVSPSYSGTVSDLATLKTRLAHFLADGTPNAVGYNGLVKTIEATAGKNYSAYNNFYRTVDLTAAKADIAKIKADSTKFTKQLTLNGSATKTQLDGQAIRYGYSDNEVKRVQERTSSNWAYNAATDTLTYTNKAASNTNHGVWINSVQTGDFEFKFTTTMIYRSGFVISNGTVGSRLTFGLNSDTGGIRICCDDNSGSAFGSAFGNTSETEYRVVVTKDNGTTAGKIEVYAKNATFTTETKIYTLTKTSIVQHVNSSNTDTDVMKTDGSQGVLAAIGKLLASNELAAGFNFTSSTTAGTPWTIKNISLNPITA